MTISALNAEFLGAFSEYMNGQLSWKEVKRSIKRKGADVNVTSEDGKTPLMWACRQNHYAFAKLLIQEGALIDAEDDTGITPMRCAIENGSLEMVKLLIKNGASIHLRHKDGCTPLLVAAAVGHLAIIKLLLHEGAEVNTQDYETYGYTPIHYASQYGNLEVVEFLIKEQGVSIYSKSDRGTPLMVACENGRLEVVKFLIQQNAAQVNVQSALTRLAPIHVAVRSDDNIKVVQFLIEQGANIQSKAKLDFTPLSIACQVGAQDVAKLLIKNGADIHSKTDDGFTALHIASEKGYLKLVESLVKKGAELNETEILGKTPFYLACENGKLEVIKFFFCLWKKPIRSTAETCYPDVCVESTEGKEGKWSFQVLNDEMLNKVIVYLENDFLDENDVFKDEETRSLVHALWRAWIRVLYVQKDKRSSGDKLETLEDGK